MDIDTFDRALLSLVQVDNRLPNRVIAKRVNLSETAVRRRLERLRASGLIKGDVALLDRDTMGQTLIVSVIFADDTPANHIGFRTRMMAQSCVTQCYSIAGEVDFIIHVHAANLRDFEAWAEQHLMGDPGIRRYETSVVFTTHKFSTAIPIPESI